MCLKGWTIRVGHEQKGVPEFRVLHTADGGESWVSASLPIAGNQDIGDGFIPTLYAKGSNWLLAAPQIPGGGSGKVLYRTDDNGASWVRLSDLAKKILGYPSGMTFINNKVGWITSKGVQFIGSLLYKTTDGGTTWTKQELPLQGYAYAYPYPPVFDTKDERYGFLPAELFTSSGTFGKLVYYVTEDSGETWQISDLPVNFAPSSKFITGDGYAITANGSSGYAAEHSAVSDFKEQGYVGDNGYGWRIRAGQRETTTCKGRVWEVGKPLAILSRQVEPDRALAQAPKVPSESIENRDLSTSPFPSTEAPLFKPGVFISEEDRVKAADHLPALEAALGFLQAWVDKDQKALMRFYPTVEKSYSDWKSYLFDPSYEYSFTEISSAQLAYSKQYVIDVEGTRRTIATGEVKLVRASVGLELQPNGEWLLYMLD
ncbi:MAG: hypothetical protein K6T85_12835 [Gorillibacterium sp.]|nr:hypothetical protein [Gorillibacterium sp.]